MFFIAKAQYEFIMESKKKNIDKQKKKIVLKLYHQGMAIVNSLVHTLKLFFWAYLQVHLWKWGKILLFST